MAPRGATDAMGWSFQLAPAIIEAINGNQLDLGYVGEAPPVFGQAASDALVYLAAEPPAPRSEAVLVKNDSAIHSVQDLKGKTLALNKGLQRPLLVRASSDSGGASLRRREGHISSACRCARRIRG